MKTWKQVKSEYNHYLSSLGLAQPQRRLSALSKIEEFLRATYPSMLKGYSLFSHIEKTELKERYKTWLGKEINSAESQVINDFYKLANGEE